MWKKLHHDTAASHGFIYKKSQLKNKPFAFEIGFVTENVEASYNEAVKAGATAVSSPAKKPWGQTISYVRDNNGFLVEICSPMK